MTTIISGTKLAQRIRANLAPCVQNFKQKVGRPPCLRVYLIGDDPASQVYVKNKEKAALELGIHAQAVILTKETSFETLASKIHTCADDSQVHAMLVQLPTPQHLSLQRLYTCIPPLKDVDGLHPLNLGKLIHGDPQALIACTPLGCMALIHEALGKDLSGKKAVVLGRSLIVGTPMAILLQQANCTVSTAHSHTSSSYKQEMTRAADIIVSAVGCAKTLSAKDIRAGACLIDVGINHKVLEGKTILQGDIDATSVTSKAGYLTPVPGGVGPMTITFLLFNTLLAAYRQHALPEMPLWEAVS